MAELHKGTLTVFDDSFQPTGVDWRNDGPLGLPNPHQKWKKLRHELVLTITGPDDVRAAVEGCLRDAAIAAAIAAVAAAFVGGGLGMTDVAWTTFQQKFLACAGNQVQARIDDQSHWIEWET